MTKYDVIIIGAGPSGLAAARDLSTSGIHVLVIESESLFSTMKTWLIFDEIVEPNSLQKAIRLSCSEGFLSHYLGNYVNIKRDRLVHVLDESKLLRLLHNQCSNAYVNFMDRVHCRVAYREHNKIVVATSSGSFLCDILIDASGGRLQSPIVKAKSYIGYYYAYARIYSNCIPSHSLSSIVLLDKGYPCRNSGEWSAPISSDRYLLGEFNFTTKPQNNPFKELDHYSNLRERLDFYTWQVQDLVHVPRNAEYVEFYGVVPITRSPPLTDANFIAIGDAAAQARPFFGVALNQIFEQLPEMVKLIKSAFDRGDFSGSFLSKFKPTSSLKHNLNFEFGLIIWRILETMSDGFANRMCGVIQSLDEDTKYNLLRAKLTAEQFLIVVYKLIEELRPGNIFRQIPSGEYRFFIQEIIRISNILRKM